MPATTLKISEELKARITALADAQGKSPHAYMLEALEHEIRRDELKQSFIEDAQAAEAEMIESGIYYDGDEVLAYLEQKLRAGKAKRPRARKL
jgi:predicted transcriptional regulator